MGRRRNKNKEKGTHSMTHVFMMLAMMRILILIIMKMIVLIVKMKTLPNVKYGSDGTAMNVNEILCICMPIVPKVVMRVRRIKYVKDRMMTRRMRIMIMVVFIVKINILPAVKYGSDGIPMNVNEMLCICRPIVPTVVKRWNRKRNKN